MNDNENKNLNINEDDQDSKQTPSAPPTFEKDDEEKDSDSKVAPTNIVVNNVQNNYNQNNYNVNVNTSSIFGFVRSMFSGVVSNFFSGGLFSSPLMRGVQNFLGQRFGFAQPQQPLFGGFIPNGIQNFVQNQFSYSQSSSKTMTLEGTDNKEVWLSNESEEVTINATTTTGTNILAGNNKDNQIFGGSGVNDMWGGSGKTNDFLFGGEGKNNFWYGKGQGVDLVENTKTGDTINLYNVTLGDISDIEITDSSISVVVGENEGLAVNTNDKISPTFKLANGESYNYNRSSAEWQSA